MSESAEEMLAEENMRLRKAGAEMAVAAFRVATEYDGVHRLMLAVSEWSKAMANEHGRGEDDGPEKGEPEITSWAYVSEAKQGPAREEEKQPEPGEFWGYPDDDVPKFFVRVVGITRRGIVFLEFRNGETRKRPVCEFIRNYRYVPGRTEF